MMAKKGPPTKSGSITVNTGSKTNSGMNPKVRGK